MGTANSLPEYISSMPVKEVNRSTKNLLKQKLDPPHRGYNKNGVMQDWTGLAELMLLEPEEIDLYENTKTSSESKTLGILKKTSFQPNSTVGKLRDMIEELERYDILDDERIINRLKLDYDAYQERRRTQEKEDEMYKEHLDKHIRPIQDPQISTNHQDLVEQKDRDHNETDNMVTWDVFHPGKQPVIFDAFVSYTLADFDFVQQLIEMLENQHDLKLCINARDLLPGASVHTVTAAIIAQRCRKVILIMSPDFLRSPECDFQMKIALSLSPGAKQKIMIPIVYRSCAMPIVLQHICPVDYTKEDIADWFWMRLAASLREATVQVSQQITFDESVKLQEVTLSLLPTTDSDKCLVEKLDSIAREKAENQKVAVVKKPRFKNQPKPAENEQELNLTNQNQPYDFSAIATNEKLHNHTTSTNQKKDNNNATSNESSGAYAKVDNRMNKNQDSGQKKKKSLDKKGLWRTKKGDKKSGDNMETDMGCVENSFEFVSGDNNEELGSPPPRDNQNNHNKCTTNPETKIDVETPLKSSGSDPKKPTESNPKPKRAMINHPMFRPSKTFFQYAKDKLATLSPLLKHRKKPKVSNSNNSLSDRSDVSNSTDDWSSMNTSSDGSTLVSDSTSGFSTLESSILKQPHGFNKHFLDRSNQPLQPRGQQEIMTSPAFQPEVNRFAPEVNRFPQQESIQLPSTATGCEMSEVESSMEVEGGSVSFIGARKYKKTRGVVLPPPLVERPNHSQFSSIGTDYSRSSIATTVRGNPLENSLYSLESHDIQLPSDDLVDDQSEVQEDAYQSKSSIPEKHQSEEQLLNRGTAPTDTSKVQYDEFEDHAFQSLTLSGIEFHFDQAHNIEIAPAHGNDLHKSMLADELAADTMEFTNIDDDDVHISLDSSDVSTTPSIKNLFPSMSHNGHHSGVSRAEIHNLF